MSDHQLTAIVAAILLHGLSDPSEEELRVAAEAAARLIEMTKEKADA